ncbi:MAG: DNA repair protein RadC [Proteobacteria bacterium]|nr:DNA repair protein RadC [Pseudomonadota bacterium]
MSIIDWPEQERPREKLLKFGSENLSDAELLAIYLQVGVKGKTAVDLARELLKHFGSFRALFEAEYSSFSQISGLGQAKYVQLQAVLELSRRYLSEQLQRQDIFKSAKDTKRFLSARLRHCENEVFAGLFLDNQNRMISYEELFKGTIHNAIVHPRVVVKRALHHNAAALILAHNHPSGIANPSFLDREITHTLKEVLNVIDVKLLDHMIVGDNQVTSLAELGLL